ncbi:class I SAM-dependent DNA methyltransferase [Chloroflexota bacterium]
MAPSEGGRLYAELCWLWPIITPPSDYLAETAAFAEAIREVSTREPLTLLNLGCGGGHHDYGLKRYFKVVGVDLSEEMLSLARNLNPEVEYTTGDMRRIRLGRTFDVVTIFDAINHMTTEEDLLACFQTGEAHLKEGGILLTIPEATAESNMQNQTFCSTHRHEDVQVTFVENHCDPDPSDTTYEMTLVFLIRKGRELSVETDRHTCGLFPIATWHRLLGQTGFAVREKRIEGTGFQTRDYPVLLATKGATT